MPRKLDLPRKDDEGNSLISYSQYASWKRNKKEYIRRYFFGESFDGNAFTDFGSKVGEALENNDFSAFEKDEQEALKQVPRLDEFEKEVFLDLVSFKLRGFVDTNDSKCSEIADYKTGKTSTGDSKYGPDSGYNQIKFYAAAIEQETGELPVKGKVYMIDRRGNPFKGEDLKVGDHHITIEQDVSKESVDKAVKELVKAAKEIALYYKVFNKLNKIKV